MSQDRGSPPHLRHNTLAFLADGASFRAAYTMVSPYSVLPAFVRQLTDSAPVVGLISTLLNAAWLLPQLLVGHLIKDRPRKKPVMMAGLSGRVLWGVVVAALLLRLDRFPNAMLSLFFVCFALFAASDGVLIVAWFDILARAIPLKQRGRLIGTSQLLSGLGGIGTGALVGAILANQRLSFPSNYALIFAISAAGMLIPSALALGAVREPPAAPIPAEEAARGPWLRRLAGDRAFIHITACRVLVGCVELAAPFYVGYAVDVLHLSPRAIGSFAVAEIAARMATGALLGQASARWGPRLVVRVAGAFALTGPLFALALHLSGNTWLAQFYPYVFVTLGVVGSSSILGFTNHLLEIAPNSSRPVYVGMFNTFSGVLALMPFLGGWILQSTSYPVLFGATAGVVGVGFLLTLGLRPIGKG